MASQILAAIILLFNIYNFIIHDKCFLDILDFFTDFCVLFSFDIVINFNYHIISQKESEA